MSIRRAVRPLFVLGLFLAFCDPALAQYGYGSTYQSVKGMDESFRIDFGGFFQKFDTTMYLESSSGQRMDINLEDMLGQDTSKTSFRADGYWRLGRHANLVFGYVGWNRSNSQTISQDIQWGDYVYHAGATVDSRDKCTVAQLYYAYSFVNTGETEFGLMLGISSYFVSAALDATGTITGPGGTTTGSYSDDNHHLTVPVPATGAYLRYTLLPGLFAEASVRWLPTVTISGYTGSMIDWRAGLDYYFTKNFGVGLVYNYTDIKASRTETRTVGAEYKYSGPYGYLSLAF